MNLDMESITSLSYYYSYYPSMNFELHSLACPP